jgi:hypothetical protein
MVDGILGDKIKTNFNLVNSKQHYLRSVSINYKKLLVRIVFLSLE